MRVDAGCDFADLFEVKDALRKKGRYTTKVERRKLTLGYERGPFERATAITASAPARFDSEGLTFTVRIPAHGEWTTEIDVATERLGVGQALRERPNPKRVQARMRRNLERWLDEAPRVECDWGSLAADVPTEPRRPRRAALLAADRRRSSRCRRPACRGS